MSRVVFERADGPGEQSDADRPPPRPVWATALALFCAATVVFLVLRDVFVPAVRDTEVWLGFELHGVAARATAPVHWLIFAVAAWGYWSMRAWIWPWASLYAAQIAVGHLVWNLTSPNGGGWSSGLWQLALFAVPAVALLWARPASTGRTAAAADAQTGPVSS